MRAVTRTSIKNREWNPILRAATKRKASGQHRGMDGSVSWCEAGKKGLYYAACYVNSRPCWCLFLAPFLSYPGTYNTAVWTYSTPPPRARAGAVRPTITKSVYEYHCPLLVILHSLVVVICRTCEYCLLCTIDNITCPLHASSEWVGLAFARSPRSLGAFCWCNRRSAKSNRLPPCRCQYQKACIFTTPWSSASKVLL